jgi:hypothetical protein
MKLQPMEIRMHDADMEIVCDKHSVIVCIDSCRPYYLAPDVTLYEVGLLVGQVVGYMRAMQRRYMEARAIEFRNH